MGELKYCRKIVKESTFKLTNKLVLENFFKAFIKDVETRAQNAQLQQLQQQQQYGSAEESLLRQKLLLKGLTQQASYYILSEPKLRKVLESFKEMKEEEEDFNCKSVRDEDIEDINRYRQIKQKLDEDSFAFYDLIGNVDPSLIEKTKNLIRQKLQKQNDQQNLLKQNSAIHSNSSSNSNPLVQNHAQHGINIQQIQQQSQFNNSSHNHGNNHHYNNSHHNHHHHLSTYPTHYNGSHFLALQNSNNSISDYFNNNNHNNNNASQLHNHSQNQQNTQIQNQSTHQIDGLFVIQQNATLNNGSSNNNSVSNPTNGNNLSTFPNN